MWRIDLYSALSFLKFQQASDSTQSRIQIPRSYSILSTKMYWLHCIQKSKAFGEFGFWSSSIRHCISRNHRDQPPQTQEIHCSINRAYGDTMDPYPTCEIWHSAVTNLELTMFAIPRHHRYTQPDTSKTPNNNGEMPYRKQSIKDYNRKGSTCLAMLHDTH